MNGSPITEYIWIYEWGFRTSNIWMGVVFMRSKYINGYGFHAEGIYEWRVSFKFQRHHYTQIYIKWYILNLASSLDYINGCQLTKVGLLIDRVSPVYRKERLKSLASVIRLACDKYHLILYIPHWNLNFTRIIWIELKIRFTLSFIPKWGFVWSEKKKKQHFENFYYVSSE